MLYSILSFEKQLDIFVCILYIKSMPRFRSSSSLLDCDPCSSCEEMCSSSSSSLSSSNVSQTGSICSRPSSPRLRRHVYQEDKTLLTSVAKLGSLAYDCSRLSASLSSVVSQSSQILDNSFLSTQSHLTEHVTSLNYKACMDIVAAIGTYEEYVVTMEEMMMAQEREEEEIVNKWEDLEEVAKELFKKVNENQDAI